VWMLPWWYVSRSLELGFGLDGSVSVGIWCGVLIDLSVSSGFGQILARGEGVDSRVHMLARTRSTPATVLMMLS
jgi:hypothetical protein